MLMATASDNAQPEAYTGDTNKCVPCKNDGSTEKAEYYCKQCQDKFCAAYEASHKTFKITRNHEVVSLTEMKKELENTNDGSNKVHCPCGKNDAEFYCKVHIDVFCSGCKWKHNQCKTAQFDEIIDNIGNDYDAETIKEANGRKEKLTELQETQENNLKQLSSTIII